MLEIDDDLTKYHSSKIGSNRNDVVFMSMNPAKALIEIAGIEFM